MLIGIFVRLLKSLCYFKENSNEMEAKLVLAQQELSSLKTALEESIMDMRSREETRQFHEQRYLVI